MRCVSLSYMLYQVLHLTPSIHFADLNSIGSESLQGFSSMRSLCDWVNDFKMETNARSPSYSFTHPFLPQRRKDPL